MSAMQHQATALGARIAEAGGLGRQTRDEALHLYIAQYEIPVSSGESRAMLISDIQKLIRENVLARITSNQISQRELALRLNLTQSHVSNFLNERRGVSIETLDGILRVLNLEVDDILPSLQVSERTIKETDCIAVPIIDLDSTMLRTLGERRILGVERFSKQFLRRLRSDSSANRKSWVRFVAVKIGRKSATDLFPWLEQSIECLIDRHYCSLKPYRRSEANIYVVKADDGYLIRYLEMHGTNLCLRPISPSEPIKVVSINWRRPLESLVVGRVARIAAEL